MGVLISDPSILDRVVQAVELVRERLLRAAKSLDAAGVPYAVAGGNAVAVWVSTIDRAAVRNTQDVDIILRRSDLDAAEAALARVGFVRSCVQGIEVFLDGGQAKMRDAVHTVIAGEKVLPDYETTVPDVSESVVSAGFTVVSLEALVRMKLTSFRRKDQVHLLDMLEVGLTDASWTSRVSPVLSARLQELIDTPER